MEEKRGHLTVVIGAAGIAEELRRALVRRKLNHAGIATHIRGLRKSMILGESDLVVVCIALDHQTISRHGLALKQLLVDHQCFPHSVRSVGLLTEIGLSRSAAEMGCDVFVDSSTHAITAIDMLARRWQRQQIRKTSSSKSKSRPTSLASQRWGDGWGWGIDVIPGIFAPLIDRFEPSEKSIKNRSRSRPTLSANKKSGRRAAPK